VTANRIVGMGGAFIGVGESADAHLVNPAAFAVRTVHALDEDFDWDWALSWLNLAGDVDVDQSGQAPSDNGQLAQGGVNLKFERLGFGLHIQQQTWTLAPEGGARVQLRQQYGGIGAAYALFDGDLTVGAVVAVAASSVILPDQADATAQVSGAGMQVGVLYAPAEQRWRLGATWRSRISGSEVEGEVDGVTSVTLPTAIVAPWELGVGGAIMFGRLFNPQPSYGVIAPEAEALKMRSLTRPYVLFAADAIVTGANTDAVGVAALVGATPRPVGRDITVGARFGVESEVIADWLILRAGTYFEPSRFETGGRVHGTGGLDVRIPFTVFDWRLRLSGAVDGADEYLNAGLGLGLWH
jgi:hypothetical protein